MGRPGFGRPKSREETPIVGYGIEEVLFRTAFGDMPLFGATSNQTLVYSQSFKWI